MKYTVSKIFSFEACHALPHLPSSHKCHRLHGHSYRVEIACSRCTLDRNGFVIDYADISEAVNPLIAQCDHQNLNTLFPFKTTAEEIGLWFYRTLEKKVPTLAWVKVYETAKTCVKVEP